MNERDFFNEKEEVKKATYSCPHCRERAEYDVRWLKRTRKPQPPRGANEQDKARFNKSRDLLKRALSCSFAPRGGCGFLVRLSQRTSYSARSRQ